jgi:hypothetical protein
MAKDVAARDLDQAGHRISNLGDPTDPADATRVDTKSTPKAAAGSGAPGTSLLAAAADHVHPASTVGGGSGGATTLSDASTQAADTAPDVVWAQAVNFDELPGDKVRCSLSAIVRVTQGATGRVELRIGGDDDKPDGTVVTALLTNSAADEVKSASADIPKPKGPTMVKLIASIASAPGSVVVRGKQISLRSVVG